jgi:hypothetical protein
VYVCVVHLLVWTIKCVQSASCHHHHHHISVMELGHLLTRSGLTYPEVSSKVCHDSFCQLGNSISLLWVIYYGAFYLHVVSSFSYIPVIYLKLVLFLIPLQFVHLFCNQSKCLLLGYKTSIWTVFWYRYLVPLHGKTVYALGFDVCSEAGSVSNW